MADLLTVFHLVLVLHGFDGTVTTKVIEQPSEAVCHGSEAQMAKLADVSGDIASIGSICLHSTFYRHAKPRA